MKGQIKLEELWIKVIQFEIHRCRVGEPHPHLPSQDLPVTHMRRNMWAIKPHNLSSLQQYLLRLFGGKLLCQPCRRYFPSLSDLQCGFITTSLLTNKWNNHNNNNPIPSIQCEKSLTFRKYPLHFHLTIGKYSTCRSIMTYWLLEILNNFQINSHNPLFSYLQ